VSYWHGVAIGEQFGPRGRNWTLDYDALTLALDNQWHRNESSISEYQYELIHEAMQDGSFFVFLYFLCVCVFFIKKNNLICIITFLYVDYRLFVFKKKYKLEVFSTEEWLRAISQSKPEIVVEGKFIYEVNLFFFF
jgi:hypothetical protein